MTVFLQPKQPLFTLQTGGGMNRNPQQRETCPLILQHPLNVFVYLVQAQDVATTGQSWSANSKAWLAFC